MPVFSRDVPSSGGAGLVPTSVLLLSLIAPIPAQGQQPRRTDFDVSRARLAQRSRFRPFRVEETQPLRAALAAGLVDDETGILVMERGTSGLAVVTRQMAYHHIAQGEMAGEPWMVSF